MDRLPLACRSFKENLKEVQDFTVKTNDSLINLLGLQVKKIKTEQDKGTKVYNV